MRSTATAPCSVAEGFSRDKSRYKHLFADASTFAVASGQWAAIFVAFESRREQKLPPGAAVPWKRNLSNPLLNLSKYGEFGA